LLGLTVEAVAVLLVFKGLLVMLLAMAVMELQTACQVHL
jgi:hypothetical protein